MGLFGAVVGADDSVVGATEVVPAVEDQASVFMGLSGCGCQGSLSSYILRAYY